MPELLLTFVQRYFKDPKGFQAKLGGRCVLLYEPPADPDSQDSQKLEERFRTVSAVTGVIGGGEPTVAYLEKTKNNAFVRRITLGRTGNNDIEIDAPSVSRFHAWFVRDETTQGWSIVDAGSKNGTQVSGKKLVPKIQTPLVDGTKMRVGQVALTFFTADGFLLYLARSTGG